MDEVPTERQDDNKLHCPNCDGVRVEEISWVQNRALGLRYSWLMCGDCHVPFTVKHPDGDIIPAHALEEKLPPPVGG